MTESLIILGLLAGIFIMSKVLGKMGISAG